MNTPQPEPIDTLRAMYRTVRDGAALNTSTYIDALLAVAADGGDVHQIMRAFERLGYWTRLDILGACPSASDRVRGAKSARGWRGAILVASLLGMRDVWADAMTAHYGPTGTHESRRGNDGVPMVETMTEFPAICERMERAARSFESSLAYYDRVNRTDYTDQVVRYSAPKAA
jgi:hypothetical protein